MTNLSKLFLLSLFIAINSAIACEFNPEGPILHAYNLKKEGEPNCDYIHDVEELMNSVQTFSEDKVSLNLFVRYVDNSPAFDGGSIIEIPERFVMSSTERNGEDYYVPLVHNITVVAHEYGHALLDKKLEKTLMQEFPEEVGYIEASKELSELKIAKLLKLNPESKENLDKAQNEIYANKKFQRFANLTAAYSELYADVVAVYYSNSKSAITDAIFMTGSGIQALRIAQLRDFNTEFTPKHEVFMNEQHSYFAYTRNYIGKKLWPKNLAEKQKMLVKIGDAIVAEVRSMLVKGTDLPEYGEANRRLIQRLKKIKL